MSELPITLLDLDDNLFQTRSKCSEFTDEELEIVSKAKNGNHSYMTPAQKRMIEWLLKTTEAIPVTARGTEAFSRVQIPFSSYAIVANGSVIIKPSGEIDSEWSEKMCLALEPYQDVMTRLRDAGQKEAELKSLSLRSWIIMENGLGAYVAFKDNNGDGMNLRDILVHGACEGWVRHHNGNNLAFIPPVVSKRIASEFLLERINKKCLRPLIGFGDSITDMSFLSLCDFWGAPRRSQISTMISQFQSKQ